MKINSLGRVIEMMNFISKDQKEKVQLLNAILGTKYRDKPFDFADDADFIEAVKVTTAEYVDLAEYWSTVEQISEQYDESIEVYTPALYTNLALTGETENSEIDEVIESLRSSADALFILKDKAESKCQKIWAMLLTENREKVNTYFFGEEIKQINFSNELIEEALSDLFELYIDIEHTGVVEDSAKKFSEALLKKLKG